MDTTTSRQGQDRARTRAHSSLVFAFTFLFALLVFIVAFSLLDWRASPPILLVLPLCLLGGVVFLADLVGFIQKLRARRAWSEESRLVVAYPPEVAMPRPPAINQPEPKVEARRDSEPVADWSAGERAGAARELRRHLSPHDTPSDLPGKRKELAYAWESPEYDLLVKNFDRLVAILEERGRITGSLSVDMDIIRALLMQDEEKWHSRVELILRDSLLTKLITEYVDRQGAADSGEGKEQVAPAPSRTPRRDTVAEEIEKQEEDLRERRVGA